ncbi:MAG: DNA-directed RNA polymerase subunit B'' [archaeon]
MVATKSVTVDRKHTLVKEFLKNHSIVESNITSFNDFIENRMQEIINEINETMPKEDFEIRLGKITVEKPNIVEADGSISLISPSEARLRGLTYSAPIKMELTIRYEGQVETAEVQLGRIPIIVKSNVCNLHGLTKQELTDRYVDPADSGGYFIVNGNERILVMAEDLASNQAFLENQKVKGFVLRLFSQRGAYKIPISINESKEGILEISFSRFRKIPVMVLLKALGMVSEAEISKMIGKQSDGLLVNLYEYASLGDSEEALMKIAELTSLQGTKKEVLDRTKQRIDSYLLPHVGLDKNARIEKAKTLCKLLKQFYISKDHPEDSLTDKDHYANKRVRLSGDLLADLFRVNLNILVREVQHSLQKTVKRRNFYSIKTIAKSTLFSHRIESAIATGSWIGERTGVTQNMKKDNFLSMMSQLQKVVSTLPGEQENFAARTVHPTHYGRFCPVETPEGTEIGLRKNLAMLARVSTRCIVPEEKIVKVLLEEKMVREGTDGVDVFLNGRFVGVVQNGKEFVSGVRERRRKGNLPIEMSFKYDAFLGAVFMSTEVGRVLRPLIVVDNGISRLKDEHLKLVESGTLTWNNLVEQGIIEYLDASEEDNCYVSLYNEEVTKEHDYVEVDPIACLGVITSIVPYANHDQAPRLLRGSKTQTQSLGIYAANYAVRIDTNVSILHYPQKPLARSFTYDTLNIYPAGQNVIVAVMPYDGYNIEDAVVLNQGSVDRGLARSSYFRPYTSVELNYAGRLKDEICIPEKDVSGYRMETSYNYLEDDGIAYPEADMKEGDVVIGKTSPPKFLSEAREISIQTKKENSTAVRQEETGIVDGVFITLDGDGNKLVQVRMRDLRKPEIGDKFATPHGQKGVIGFIAPELDVPFTANGVRPDLLFNPHGIPSRMTVGYLLEMMAGKVAALSGVVRDASAFAGEELDSLENNLKKLGFRYDGKEVLYHGVTGQRLPVKIFVGNMYYLKLGRMVKNLLHARASGKIALLTRQPIEGRSRGGGLRLGEMEQQALVAHGASLLLKERYDSDKVVLHICERCGSLATDDKIRDKQVCPMCQSNKIEPVELSYAFKLLLEELQGMHLLTKFELKNKYDQ